MKFAEALKTVLCDSEKGIDYNKTVVGKDFELSFFHSQILIVRW